MVGRAAACPLCAATTTLSLLPEHDSRRYWHCAGCALIHVDPACHLGPQQERDYYGLHQNSIDDAGYVDWLHQIIDPLRGHLRAGARGLDFGCGPDPTLSILMRRHGHVCEDYDPLFHPRPPRPPYDFVLATECFEHFHRPRQEIERIHGLLAPDGLLGIMTERWTSLEAFARWHYTRDPTHVVFYHADSFDWICRHWGFETVETDARRVMILRRVAR